MLGIVQPLSLLDTQVIASFGQTQAVQNDGETFATARIRVLNTDHRGMCFQPEGPLAAIDRQKQDVESNR